MPVESPSAGAPLGPVPLFPSLVTGAVVGIYTLIYALAFGALLFGGDLAPFLGQGIGLLLVSAIITATSVALTSACPGAIAGTQDTTVAVLTPLVASVAASVAVASTSPTDPIPAQQFATVVVLIGLNSVASGALLVGLGRLNLGRLIRYMPYPVVGGFLAGTGWLLLTGAITLTTGAPMMALLMGEGHRGLLGLELSLGLGLGLWVLQRRYPSPWFFLAAVGAAVALFYGGLGGTGHSLTWAQDRGLLLGPFPGGSLWPAAPWTLVGQVHWPSLGHHLVRLPALWLIDALALLLNLTGLELVRGQDLDLNRELQSAGGATMLSGLVGGISGFHALGDSALVYRLGTPRRVVGLAAAAVPVGALVIGAAPLAWVPKPVVGGLLVFLGLDFLLEWLVLKRSTLAGVELALVWAILLAIALRGVLTGVTLGLLAAMVIFVVDYSRLPPTRAPRNAAICPSPVQRSPSQRQFLRQAGQQVLILPLEGVIFFGTAVQLSALLAQRLGQISLPPLRFVLLDFAAVRGLDASAVLSLTKLRQQATQGGAQLVFTGLATPQHNRLQRWGLVAGLGAMGTATELAPDQDNATLRDAVNALGQAHTPDLPPGDDLARLLAPTPPTLLSTARRCPVFTELPIGIAWCEAQLLAASPLRRQRFLPLPLQLEGYFPQPAQVATLMTYLQARTLRAGEVLFHQGDPYDGLYFLEAGQLSVLQDSDPPRQSHILRTHLPGTVIGEMGLYTRAPRSATAVAVGRCRLYGLSPGAFEKLEAEQPALAAAFHRLVVQQLAERLRQRPLTAYGRGNEGIGGERIGDGES